MCCLLSGTQWWVLSLFSRFVSAHFDVARARAEYAFARWNRSERCHSMNACRHILYSLGNGSFVHPITHTHKPKWNESEMTAKWSRAAQKRQKVCQPDSATPNGRDPSSSGWRQPRSDAIGHMRCAPALDERQSFIWLLFILCEYGVVRAPNTIGHRWNSVIQCIHWIEVCLLLSL